MTGPISGFSPQKCCCPHKICPVDHYPFFIRSGLANIVGPKICLNNTIIMGGLINNIGRGLNIVVVKGETGEILAHRYFNVFSGGEFIMYFLKSIQIGSIVLVASYDDPAAVLTDEIIEIFAGLGSTMSGSVKKRDTWVFAGSAGILEESQFEKINNTSISKREGNIKLPSSFRAVVCIHPSTVRSQTNAMGLTGCVVVKKLEKKNICRSNNE
uniref:FAM3 metabolism regulating signaling molecule D n=1 Tax=Pygocentrus nattereri TaxID=42514 RepID=A0A3B4DSL4_PYGNA